MVIFLSRSTGRGGVERVHAPFRLHAAPLAHFARTWGRTVTCHGLLFAPLLWCTHPSICPPPRLGCTLLRSHTLPLACTQGRTITLSHPHFGAPALLFVCGSPTWVVPHLARMPFACVPPVLLHPTACVQRERVCGQGGVCKLGGGHGVVWVEGTVGGHACGVGA